MNLKSLLPVGRNHPVAASPFVSLQREIDRLFDDFTRGFPTFPGNGAVALARGKCFNTTSAVCP